MTTTNPFINMQPIKWEDTPFHAPEQEVSHDELQEWLNEPQYTLDDERTERAIEQAIINEDLPF